MVGGVVKAAYLARPASSTLGTFGRAGKVKTTGLRPLTRAELNAQLKALKSPVYKGGPVKAKDIKQTAIFEKKWPIKRDTVYIVNEGPAGKLEVRAAQLYEHPRAPGLTPGTTPKLKPIPWGAGGARAATPSTATMTRNQLALKLGIDPVTIGKPVILPIPLLRPRPGKKPEPLPGPVPLPVPAPRRGPRPSTRPSPATRPGEAPSPVPAKAPGPAPRKGPAPKAGGVPEPIKGPGPGQGPVPTPTSVPVPVPVPQPQPKPAPAPPPPVTEIPPKPPPPVPGVPPPPRGFILPPAPASNAPDEEKRAYLEKVEGLVARRRGQLGGKSVWLINFYPYGKADHITIVGAAPKGAKLATGKGSVSRSATLLKGIPPKKPIYSDTGAVDDVITARGRRIIISSVRDRRYLPNRHLPTRRMLDRGS